VRTEGGGAPVFHGELCSRAHGALTAGGVASSTGFHACPNKYEAIAQGGMEGKCTPRWGELSFYVSFHAEAQAVLRLGLF